MQKRDEYIAKMKSQFDTINAGIDELERKADQVKGDAQDRYQKELDKLRQQSKEFKSKIVELKSAGEDRWDKMSAEVEKVSDAIKHSYNYFKSQL